MNSSYKKILDDLNSSPLKKGDDVLIHSSYKSLGYIEGGIKTLIEALISHLGDRGTLMFPTLSYISVNNPESEFVFDIKKSPCCVGAIPDFFRSYNGAIRSMHPTHSVTAYGFRAEEYTKKHYLDHTPVGINSPFSLLPEYGGKVLMLGCGTRPNTSMHGVEEKAGAPYVISDVTRRYTLIDQDGNKSTTDNYYHWMTDFGYIQRYDRLENLMEYQKFKILNADCNLIDCATMWRVGESKILEDTYYFTDREC